ncbi:MAG: hypothetical protein KGY66_03460 [Candidatus Thermoplasmatota archaeon]|nr:hypothetical protein [Candidatus Thermoplasmatota archaeon]
MPRSTPHTESTFDAETRQSSKKEKVGNLLYYIVMSLIVVGAIGGIILLGGMLRLTLAILILLVIGSNLVYWSMEETRYSDIWERDDEFDEVVNLKLKKNSDLVKRAFKGMELSQGYLEKKIRDLFLDKLMDDKNLSREETRELLKDSEKFRQVVDDEVISDFILSKREEDEQSSIERLEGEDYGQWISTLLKRIEGWE